VHPPSRSQIVDAAELIPEGNRPNVHCQHRAIDGRESGRYVGLMAGRLDERRRDAVNLAVGAEGGCANAIAVSIPTSRRTQVGFGAPFVLFMLAFELAPFTNVTFALFITMTVAAMAVQEISTSHYLIGALPDGVVVVSLRDFSRRPIGVVKKLPWPVAIDVESKFSTYKVTIDGVVYEAGGRTYPEWLKMIEQLEWTPVGES